MQAITVLKSPGSTKNPFSPDITISLTAPLKEPMTGRANPMASRWAIPKPSWE